MDTNDPLSLLCDLYGFDCIPPDEKKGALHHDAGIFVAGGTFPERNVMACQFTSPTTLPAGTPLPFHFDDSGIFTHQNNGGHIEGCQTRIHLPDVADGCLWLAYHAQLYHLFTQERKLIPL